ncbi:MAG: threonylcarbamoyl-AMP synthase [Christensenellaceae bacterium]|jgi:tRNA threonylcarbamoyl adenosine modification protein (Sua5/YciO/YrdC/YwlC family)|nr:threonylcarbamoyl-AMP synthase [Christensenellaceae bacterium]
METRIITTKEIALAAAEIACGGLVAFPTETVYGLGADASDPVAIDKIYAAKGRPKDNPFIVHCASISDAEKAAYITEDARKLFELFSPGPLTVVLKKKPLVCAAATAGLDTVGIRIPASPAARLLIKKSGKLIAAPSANISGRVSPTSAQEVFEALDGKIAYILDGGECSVGIESVIISLAGDSPVILRPGKITRNELQQALEKDVLMKTSAGDSAPVAPGMKYTHYSPKIPTVGFTDIDKATAAAANEKDSVIIAPESLLNWEIGNFLSLGFTIDSAMRRLYSSLLLAEKEFSKIYLFVFPDGDDTDGLNNRIRKAIHSDLE